MNGDYDDGLVDINGRFIPQSERPMPLCRHSRYSDQHCADNFCYNYFNRCPVHCTSGDKRLTCTHKEFDDDIVLDDYRKPNTYISPFVLYNILIPQLETFLQRYGDESFDKENENANDSWQWTVEEARRLYMELNSNK